MKQTVSFVFVLYHTSQEEILRLQKEFYGYDVYFIDNTASEKGYAYGANKGIRKALKNGADIVFIANPDISIERSSLRKLIEISAHYDIFGYAFEQNGTTYYGGKIDRVTMGGGLIEKKPRLRFSSVDFVSGSLMGVRREVVKKLGFLDESFGMYYEDVDYCIRARQAGFKVGVDADIVYKHFETSTMNPHKKWFLAKNRFKIIMKHGDLTQKALEILRLPLTIFRYIFL